MSTRSTLRISSAAIALLLAFFSIAAAQQRIDGSVVATTTRAPLASANLKLEGAVLSESQSQTTNSDGGFSFPDLSPGEYVLSVSADTFYPQQISLQLGPRAAARIEVSLNPLPSLQVLVTVHPEARLLDETQTGTITTLNSEQISLLPVARRTQLSDLITPLVSSAIAGHDNLVHLRGNELSLNTFVNGVSFFDNPHQLFTPGLAPDVIQSVNVITGGFPAEFGNRFGGILDVVTRSGFDTNNRGSVTIGGGTFLRNNLSFNYGGHTKKLGYFVYGGGFESERFLNTPVRPLYHDFGKGARSFLQLDYRLSDNDLFKFVFTGNGTNFQLPNTTEDEMRGRDFFQRNREQSAILSWEHVFSPVSALNTSFYERSVMSRFVPTSDPSSIQAGGRRDDITVGAKTDYGLYVGSRHAIKAGVDLTLLRLREDFSFDPRDNGIEISKFDFRDRRTGGQASAYFQDQVKLAPDLTANLGVRYDQYSLVTSGHALSPRINIAYSLPGSHTLFHFAYNRFFSPPPIENLLLSTALGVGGEPPNISRSNNFEAGATHSLRNRILVHLTGYWRSDTNAFETTELANVRIFAPTTFAHGKAYGIEFASQLVEIKRVGLSSYFNYTTQRAFQTGPVSGGFTVEESEPGERNPAAFDQIHTAVGGITWRERHTGFWTSAAFEYGSGTPATFRGANDNETRVRLPAHFVTNLYFGLELKQHERHKVSLQFNIENLTNRSFQIAKESEFTPVQFAPPRFVSASLRLSF